MQDLYLFELDNLFFSIEFDRDLPGSDERGRLFGGEPAQQRRRILHLFPQSLTELGEIGFYLLLDILIRRIDSRDLLYIQLVGHEGGQLGIAEPVEISRRGGMHEHLGERRPHLDGRLVSYGAARRHGLQDARHPALELPVDGGFIDCGESFEMYALRAVRLAARVPEPEEHRLAEKRY